MWDWHISQTKTITVVKKLGHPFRYSATLFPVTPQDLRAIGISKTGQVSGLSQKVGSAKTAEFICCDWRETQGFRKPVRRHSETVTGVRYSFKWTCSLAGSFQITPCFCGSWRMQTAGRGRSVPDIRHLVKPRWEVLWVLPIYLHPRWFI